MLLPVVEGAAAGEADLRLAVGAAEGPEGVATGDPVGDSVAKGAAAKGLARKAAGEQTHKALAFELRSFRG